MSTSSKDPSQQDAEHAQEVGRRLLSSRKCLLALSQLCVMLGTALALGSSGSAQAQSSAPITSLKEAPVGPDGRGQPVSLEKQGSFFAGGTVVTSTAGDTFHGDQAYVEFQIPHDARELPMVMLSTPAGM